MTPRREQLANIGMYHVAVVSDRYWSQGNTECAVVTVEVGFAVKLTPAQAQIVGHALLAAAELAKEWQRENDAPKPQAPPGAPTFEPRT